VESGELWDLIDSDGVATGETFLRGTPGWPEGRFHLIVATCICRPDGMVLLTQRAPGKEFAFGWEFPGGSALAGESSRVAASRELREETGIVAAPEDLALVGRFAEASALLDFYIAAAPASAALRLQASEVMAAEWVMPDEVEQRITERTMALPWDARLRALWSDAKTAMTTIR
jgi:8-oxo-dGTP pyrophosphatase MutT (NUDIX family)